jgi:YVTN family beta-propeller protein
MTITIQFLNNATKKPEVYIDKPEADKFTLQITSDNTSPIPVTELKVKLPVSIFDTAVIGKITASPAWTVKAEGPSLLLTPTDGVELSSTSPLAVELSGITSSKTGVPPDHVDVNVDGPALSTTIVLMHYPQGAADLRQDMDAALIPGEIFVTPPNSEKIENPITLRLTNKKKTAPLVSDWSGTPPTIQASFVYGNDIGSLTPADPASKDPHSAFNIKFDVLATYGHSEWLVIPPEPGATTPIWTLQPAKENSQVLAAGSGANVEFKISNISTTAPAGFTQMYLQYSDFPGYDAGYITLSLEKKEPLSPPEIEFGGSISTSAGTLKLHLYWKTQNAKHCEIVGDPAHLEANVDAIVDPYIVTASTDRPLKYRYTLRAYGGHGEYRTKTVILTSWKEILPRIKVGEGEWPSLLCVTHAADRLFVANRRDRTVTPIQIGVNPPRVHAAIDICPTDISIASVCVTPDGTRLFVATPETGTVTTVEINLNPPRVGAAIKVGGRPFVVCVTPDGNRLFVASRPDKTVTHQDQGMGDFLSPIEIGVSPPTVGAPIQVGRVTTSACVTPDGNWLFVTSSQDNTVTPIEIGVSPSRVGRAIQVGTEPYSVCATPDGIRVFVTNSRDNTVTPIDISVSPPKVGAAIEVGGEPASLCVTPDGCWLFVTNCRDNTVTPIDISVSPPRVGAAIKVGERPTAMCVTPDGTTVFVPNQRDGTVLVLCPSMVSQTSS